MSRFSQVDLSKLPAPDIIKPATYEVLLADMKLETIQAMPELAPFLALESEPVSKLLRVCAWFRFLDRLEFNDDARGCMLALATGPNLDGLAAFWYEIGDNTLTLSNKANREAHRLTNELFKWFGFMSG